jgi:dTDP-4-dehydrorhamnose 3,5-epimerase-like enzyme
MSTDLYQTIERRKIVDERGFFLKTMTGFEPGLPQTFGEIYVIKGDQGKARANHYHDAATEWFTLLQGQVRLNLRHVDTGRTASLLLTDESPMTIRVNPRVAHSLIGVDGQDYVLMAYTDLRYDPSDTIAHPPILP